MAFKDLTNIIVEFEKFMPQYIYYAYPLCGGVCIYITNLTTSRIRTVKAIHKRKEICNFKRLYRVFSRTGGRKWNVGR